MFNITSKVFKNAIAGLLAIVVLISVISSPWLLVKINAQQAGCLTNSLADGLVSANEIAGLGSTIGVCITGAPAYIPTTQTKQYKVDSYEDLYTHYFKNAKGATKVIMNPVSSEYDISVGSPYSNIATNTLFYADGNLTVHKNAFGIGNPPTAKLGIFFVNGNLFIPSDLIYGQNNPLAGLVFVVKGQINIGTGGAAPDNIVGSAQRIDAVLISEGTTTGGNRHSLCTACDSGGIVIPIDKVTNNFHPSLTISGGVVSLNSNNQMRLRRVPNDTAVAAENIIAEPKYLVILKDTISKTIKIWSEI